MNEPPKMFTLKQLLFKLATEHVDCVLSAADVLSLEEKLRKLIARVSQSKSGASDLPPMNVLNQRYIYDPLTGKILRTKKDGKLKEVGSRYPSGYIRLNIVHKKQRFRVAANRLAWALYYGEPPPAHLVVDHLDDNKSNNAISNLQLALHSTNMTLDYKRKNPSAG